MIELYAELVRKGKKKIEQVPARIREAVRELLENE